jgi:hypothetical protein
MTCNENDPILYIYFILLHAIACNDLEQGTGSTIVS